MKAKQVIFIQGGGDNGYDADSALVLSLKKNLGNEYQVDYPAIQSDETSSDFGWTKQIGEIINKINQDTILVGHSFGASMILKYFSENSISKSIKAIFLLATPFWSGNDDWQKGLKLKEDFAYKLSNKIPIFLYHCQDDEEVPFSHFNEYKKRLAKATFRQINIGGHQFSNDLAFLATEIKFYEACTMNR
ncbi:alpha/beta fold hydrolase [Segetibacter koreensis]|uniref:alpha/beta fold hydrolase n=1 Tax=Segetibacter koreensis TaxID=398037 RepID=UPI000372442B|nr:alpha/beta fold hydrolase [Segetibacter koreensis]